VSSVWYASVSGSSLSSSSSRTGTSSFICGVDGGGGRSSSASRVKTGAASEADLLSSIKDESHIAARVSEAEMPCRD